eukprot:g3113.t1
MLDPTAEEETDSNVPDKSKTSDTTKSDDENNSSSDKFEEKPEGIVQESSLGQKLAESTLEASKPLQRENSTDTDDKDEKKTEKSLDEHFLMHIGADKVQNEKQNFVPHSKVSTERIEAMYKPYLEEKKVESPTKEEGDKDGLKEFPSLQGEDIIDSPPPGVLQEEQRPPSPPGHLRHLSESSTRAADDAAESDGATTSKLYTATPILDKDIKGKEHGTVNMCIVVPKGKKEGDNVTTIVAGQKKTFVVPTLVSEGVKMIISTEENTYSAASLGREVAAKACVVALQMTIEEKNKRRAVQILMKSGDNQVEKEENEKVTVDFLKDLTENIGEINPVVQDDMNEVDARLHFQEKNIKIVLGQILSLSKHSYSKDEDNLFEAQLESLCELYEEKKSKKRKLPLSSTYVVALPSLNERETEKSENEVKVAETSPEKTFYDKLCISLYETALESQTSTEELREKTIDNQTYKDYLELQGSGERWLEAKQQERKEMIEMKRNQRLEEQNNETAALQIQNAKKRFQNFEYVSDARCGEVQFLYRRFFQQFSNLNEKKEADEDFALYWHGESMHDEHDFERVSREPKRNNLIHFREVNENFVRDQLRQMNLEGEEEYQKFLIRERVFRQLQVFATNIDHFLGSVHHQLHHAEFTYEDFRDTLQSIDTVWPKLKEEDVKDIYHWLNAGTDELTWNKLYMMLANDQSRCSILALTGTTSIEEKKISSEMIKSSIVLLRRQIELRWPSKEERCKVISGLFERRDSDGLGYVSYHTLHDILKILLPTIQNDDLELIELVCRNTKTIAGKSTKFNNENVCYHDFVMFLLRAKNKFESEGVKHTSNIPPVVNQVRKRKQNQERKLRNQKIESKWLTFQNFVKSLGQSNELLPSWVQSYHLLDLFTFFYFWENVEKEIVQKQGPSHIFLEKLLKETKNVCYPPPIRSKFNTGMKHFKVSSATIERAILSFSVDALVEFQLIQQKIWRKFYALTELNRIYQLLERGISWDKTNEVLKTVAELASITSVIDRADKNDLLEFTGQKRKLERAEIMEREKNIEQHQKRLKHLLKRREELRDKYEDNVEFRSLKLSQKELEAIEDHYENKDVPKTRKRLSAILLKKQLRQRERGRLLKDQWLALKKGATANSTTYKEWLERQAIRKIREGIED